MICSVIIPTYNGGELLRACLKSIERLNFPKQDFEVIVVDNNSTDNTKAIIAEFPFKYVSEHETQSSYAARNAGVAAAQGKLLAFTDSDCEVHPDWLSHIVDAASRNPKAGCIAGEIEPFPGATLVERFSDKIGLLRQRGPLSGWHFKPYAQTANASFRRDVFDRIGLFDGHVRSGGDATFAWRMLDNTDYEIVFVPQAIVYHHHRTDLPALWSQFRRYGGGKVSWMQQEKTYPPPRVTDQETDLVKAFDTLLGSMQKVGLNEDEFVYPLLSIATKSAHHSGFLQDMLRHLTGKDASNEWPALAASSATGGQGSHQHSSAKCPICGGTTFVAGPNNRLADGKPPLCRTCNSLERHRVIHALAPIFLRHGGANWAMLSFGETPPAGTLLNINPRFVRTLDPGVTGPFDAIFSFARTPGPEGSFGREIDYYSDRLAKDGILTIAMGLGALGSASTKQAGSNYTLGIDAGWQVAHRMPEHSVLQVAQTDEATGVPVRLVFASRNQSLLDDLAEAIEGAKGVSTFVSR